MLDCTLELFKFNENIEAITGDIKILIVTLFPVMAAILYIMQENKIIT